VSGLQRDQTDTLREVQKWATDECHNKTQLPSWGLLLPTRQSCTVLTEPAPCNAQKQRSPDGPAAVPMPW